MLKSFSEKKVEKRCIGFACGSEPKKKSKKPRGKTFRMASDRLFQFDDGEGVSFADGSHNTIVLGTTGSGKTTSLIFPALSQMIKAGFSGLVVDVKGNMANYVRKIANEHGRLGDVVEFGPGPAATPINIFWGMPMYDVEKLFRIMFQFDKVDNGHSHNSSFHEEGLQKVLDCLELYLTMCRKLGMDFQFGMFNRIINDFLLTQKIHAHYRNNLYDPNSLDEQKLVARIDGDGLHYILPANKDPKHRSKDWAEQNSYRMKVIKTCIERFMRFPALIRNFLGGSKENFDIAERIYQKKQIVVLRLATELGTTGEQIARWVMHEYYQAVYRNGKSLSTGQYTFCVADEVQDFYSSNRDDPLNDNSFVSKCREFNCINIYGTQSVSAMAARADRGWADCAALIGNCNVRVFLYSDDPSTKSLAPKRLPDLESLSAGRANMAKYDVESREHLYGTVGTQGMFRELQELFARQAGNVPETVVIEACQHLTEDEKASELDMVTEQSAILTGAAAAPKEGKAMNTQGTTQRLEDLVGTSTSLSVTEKNIVSMFREFPEYFAPAATANDLAIPAGWLEQVRRALLMMRQAGLAGRISRFNLNTEHIRPFIEVIDDDNSKIFVKAMNNILENTRNMCMICGNSMEQGMDFDDGMDENDRSRALRRAFTQAGRKTSFFCNDCMARMQPEYEENRPRVRA